MPWHNTTDGLMRMVDYARANPALIDNHLEGVLPKLYAMREKNQELIAAFEIAEDVAEVAALQAEQARLAEGIAYYQSARSQAHSSGG